MGSSNSKQKIEQIFNNKIALQSDLQSLISEETNCENNIIAAINNASSTDVSMVNNRKMTGSVISIGKGATVEGSQKINGTITISAQKVAEIASTVSNDITTSFMNEINNNWNADLMNQMSQLIDTTTTSGNGVGKSNSNADIKTEVNNDVNMSTSQKIEQYMKDVINNTINNQINNSCSNNVNAMNKDEYENVSVSLDENATFNIGQGIDLTITTECIQNAKLNIQMMNALAKGIGVTVKNDMKTTTSNTSDTTSSTSATSKGLIDEAGDAVGGIVDSTGDALSGVMDSTGNALGNVVDSAGNAVSGIFSSATSIIFIIGCVVCVVLIAAVFGISYILTDETGASAVSNLANTAVSAANPVSKVIGGSTCEYFIKSFVDKIM